VSKYFEILERLEQGRGESGARPAERPTPPRPAPAPFGASAPSARSRVADHPVEAPVLIAPLPMEQPIERPEVREEPAPPPVSAAPARRVARPTRMDGVDTVFNNLEALTHGRRPMTLVFAGAATTASAGDLVARLAEYARGRGFGVVVGEFEQAGGVAIVRAIDVRGAGDAAAVAPLSVDLHGAPNPALLSDWRARVSAGSEILFVVAPSLGESVDAALLVAVQDETPREALVVAAERAKVTSAPTLGVVVHASAGRLPAWLRRLVE
jgi:hypothetical protein